MKTKMDTKRKEPYFYQIDKLPGVNFVLKDEYDFLLKENVQLRYQLEEKDRDETERELVKMGKENERLKIKLKRMNTRISLLLKQPEFHDKEDFIAILRDIIKEASDER